MAKQHHADSKAEAAEVAAAVGRHIQRVQHESWRHFVDLAYWNVELSD